MNRPTLRLLLDHLPEVTRQEVAGIVLSQPSDVVATTVLFDVVVGHGLPGWEIVVGAVARTGAPWSPPSAGNPEDVARTIALGILVPENEDRHSDVDRAALDEVATSLLLLVLEDEPILANTPPREVVTFAETLLAGIDGADAPFTRSALQMLADQIDDGPQDVEDDPPFAPSQRRSVGRPPAAGFDAILGMIDQVGDIADVMQGIFKRIFPR